jgi:hypothetical protein
VALKLTVAAVLLVRAGGALTMLTAGKVLSTVQVWLALLLLPTVSVARTVTVCSPSPRPV